MSFASASSHKHATQQSTNTSTNRNTTIPSDGYDAFRAVDDLVMSSKPILGSDGAAQWQAFRQNQPNTALAATTVIAARLLAKQSSNAAPTAPLKRADRAAGFSSWQEERQQEMHLREVSGHAPMHTGYTHFKLKGGGGNPASNSNTVSATALANRANGTKRPPKRTTYSDDDNNDHHSLPVDHPIHLDPMASNIKTKDKKKKESKHNTANLVATSGPIVIDNPNHPLEQVAAALRRQQEQQHQSPFLDVGDRGSTSRDEQTSNDLPVGWHSAVDHGSGQTYYYHPASQTRQWERPLSLTTSSSPTKEELEAASNTITSAASANMIVSEQGEAAPLPLPEGWSATQDPVTQLWYYYHAVTGQTTWDRPVIVGVLPQQRKPTRQDHVAD